MEIITCLNDKNSNDILRTMLQDVLCVIGGGGFIFTKWICGSYFNAAGWGKDPF